ncbi:MAG: ESPR-type extended signal peptide-containing protein [Pyramidobacter sp.]|jgi:hypothetical protein
MNKIYKVIWSKVRACYVVASELVTGHSRGTSLARAHRCGARSGVFDGRHGGKGLMPRLAAALLCVSAVASAGTAWGAVVSGYNNPGQDAYSFIAFDPNNWMAPYVWGVQSFAMGSGAKAYGNYSIAMGGNAKSNGINSVSIGDGASAYGDTSITLGAESLIQGYNFGSEQSPVWKYGEGNIAIGYNAQVLTSDAFTNQEIPIDKRFTSFATALVYQAVVDHRADMALGREAKADAYEAVAIGTFAEATSERAMAVGSWAKAKGAYSTAVGLGASTEPENSTAVGFQAKTTAYGGIAIGGRSQADRELKTYGYNPLTGKQFEGGSEAEIDSEIAAALGRTDELAAADAAIATAKQAVADAQAVGDQTALEKAKDDLEAAHFERRNVLAPYKPVAGAVSVGNESRGLTRQITHVAGGSEDSDAVNVAQLKALNTALTETGLKFWANSGNVATNQLGSTVKVVGGGTKDDAQYASGNVKTVVSQDTQGNTAIEVMLDKTITADAVQVGEKGENGVDGKIGVAGKDGSSVVINGEDGSIGLNGKDGTNGLTIKGEKGDVGVDGTDGHSGTNGMTRIVYVDANSTSHDVATLDDGLKFKGDDATVIAKKLNEQLNITGGVTSTDLLTDNNIGVVSNASGDLTVKLSKTLTGLDSVTTGATKIDSTGLTVNNKTYVSDAGLNANNQKITSVANGTIAEDSKDAVNGGQLKAVDVKVDANTQSITNLTTTVGGNTTNIKALQSGFNLTVGTSTSNVALGVTPTPNIEFAASGDDALTVSLNGTKVTYSLDSSKLPSSTAVHYFHVNADDSASPEGTNWNNDGAKSAGSIAIGKKAETLKLGKETSETPEDISSEEAVALGSNASAAGNDSVAIGKGATTGTRYEIAPNRMVISQNTAAEGAVAVGEAANARTDGSVAIGRNTAVGNSAYARDAQGKFYKEILHGIAIGDGAKAIGNVGDNDDAGIAFGRKAKVEGNMSIAMGTGAHAENVNNIIIGANATTEKLLDYDGKSSEGPIESIGIGTDSVVKGRRSVALGAQTSVGTGKRDYKEKFNYLEFDGVALGYNSKVDRISSIGLGAWTKPWRNKAWAQETEWDENIKAEQNKYTQGAKIKAPLSGTELYFYDQPGSATLLQAHSGNVVNGVVSVGGVYSTTGSNKKTPFLRQIINVADGTEATDAVNLRQLNALNTRVDSNAVHYFSVDADDSAAPENTNWNNDGATGQRAIAIGQKAKAGTAD